MDTRRGVVVTGASAGLGRAIARHFAAAGADVALLARGSDGLEAARKEIEDMGGRAVHLEVDVSDADGEEEAAAAAEQELGQIDVWVNNAMVSIFAPFTDISPEDFRRVTDVTYLGYVHGTMAALRRMLPRDEGVIVHIGSALAYRAIPLQSPYCGAKHAIEGFTEALRCELLHDKSNIRMTTVQMPALNTPQFEWVKTNFDRHPQPVPPIFDPEPAARAVVHAATHPRREYWFGWSTARAILANRVVPALLDRYLAKFGIDAQKTDWPIDPNRPHNLYDSPPGDQGMRGKFISQSRSRSLQWWASVHRTSIAAGAVASGAAIWGALRRRHKKS